MSTYIKALFVSLMFIIPFTAQAQGRNCAPREVVLESLTTKYGESRQNIGIGQRGMVMETFANMTTGSWTIMMTMPAGMSCLLASGQSFEVLSEEPTDQGDPT